MCDLHARLTQASERLDQLLRDVSGGIRGPAHYNQLEGEATDIGVNLRSAFRTKGRR